jgi:hypothetical protein
LRPRGTAAHDARACEPIVQEALLPIDEGPQKAGAAESESKQSGNVSKQGLAHRDARTIARHELHAPCFHGERLSAAGPVP